VSAPAGSMVATRSCGSAQLAVLMWEYVVSRSQTVSAVWTDGRKQVCEYHYDPHLSLSRPWIALS
jgi:hypothetical protein